MDDLAKVKQSMTLSQVVPSMMNFLPPGGGVQLPDPSVGTWINFKAHVDSLDAIAVFHSLETIVSGYLYYKTEMKYVVPPSELLITAGSILSDTLGKHNGDVGSELFKQIAGAIKHIFDTLTNEMSKEKMGQVAAAEMKQATIDGILMDVRGQVNAMLEDAGSKVAKMLLAAEAKVYKVYA